MDRIKKLLHRNIKLIIALLIFVSIGAGVTYSATTYLYDSNVIGYDKSNSGLTATDVQGALDELYTKCQSSGDGDHVCYEKINVLSVISQGAVSDGIKSTYVNSNTGINFGAISSDTNGKGVYIRAGTVGTPNPIYYYRGAVTNNNVIFANFCWKIVRTTETGGIKLIYNGIPSSGECINSTAATTRIGQSPFVNENRRADYTYDVNGVETSSAVKNYIDNWYASNMTAYTSYLEDTVWCNNRGDAYYPLPPYERLTNSKSPSLDCTFNADRYTVNTSNGNGKLIYPVALLTADEISFAGAVVGVTNTTYYLYTGDYSWSLSPSTYIGTPYSQWCAYNTYVDTFSQAVTFYSEGAVRPSVSLKSGTNFAYGNGTAESPYVVATETQSTFSCPPDYSCYKNMKISAILKKAVKDTNIDFSQPSSATNGRGLYIRSGTENDTYPIYYYRGSVDNNVLFANFCWKFVRTTETGGIKLIYNGTPISGQCTNTTGTSTIIGSGLYNSNGSSNISNVSYTYGNNVNTTIKTAIDDWYAANMTSYTSYLEDAIWCNDRSGSSSGYGAYIRLVDNKSPSFYCPNIEDRYTVDSANGNGKLTYPVGLITADELSFAGEVYLGGSSDSYVNNGDGFWTMSPFHLTSSGARVFKLLYNQGITDNYVNNVNYGYRPVISLKNDTEFSSGDGTNSRPFVVDTN